jgi:glycosyltransferase involved in cell wall biosynthesis
MPTIDILIPVANGIEFLFESVQSVVAQTYADWECWIVLNGIGLSETAQTVADAVATMDPRIHVMSVSATDKCEALNTAVKRMTAPWIAVLDVDDRWLPTKLAVQMAAASPEMSVLGTKARYFGDHTGIPSIPSGWIDPAILPTVNPLINSSVLIRRDLADWTYGDGIAQTMEDYYLWMRLALAGHRFFNCPEILTEHRVHSNSAFNSQGRSPAELQAWYRSVLAEQPQLRPLRILTIATSQPLYIRAQYMALLKHVKDSFEFIVFNDAKSWPDPSNFGDTEVRFNISQLCKRHGIQCIEVPNDHHRFVRSPSQRHCDTLRTVMQFVHESPGRYWMLDSDMFPIADIHPDTLAKYFGGSFVKQRRLVGGRDVVYAWPNLWWIDTSVTDCRDLSWDLAPGCDTGGASSSWFQKQENEKVQWIPHLASGAWTLTQLPRSLTSHTKLLQFLTQDPRNTKTGDTAEILMESEIYDECILHLRAGSNWREEGRRIHDSLVDHMFALFLK